ACELLLLASRRRRRRARRARLRPDRARRRVGVRMGTARTSAMQAAERMTAAAQTAGRAMTAAVASPVPTAATSRRSDRERNEERKHDDQDARGRHGGPPWATRLTARPDGPLLYLKAPQSAPPGE